MITTEEFVEIQHRLETGADLTKEEGQALAKFLEERSPELFANTKVDEIKVKAHKAYGLMKEVIEEYPQVREGNERISGLLDVFGKDMLRYARILANYTDDFK